MASVQTAAMAVCEEEEAERASRRGRKARKRNRATVSEIYENMGPNLFRRYYPMSYESFWILHDKLGDSIEICTMAVQGWTASSGGDESGFGGGSGRGGNHTDPPTPNGKISSDVRLGCALRYFAGGSPGDILSTYRISLTSVLLSVSWGVVEAVNQCEEFHISYPPCHELQRRIAADFASVSDVNFTACAGAIDGVLICIGKPSEKDAKSSGISQKKLFCARKNKFGLNCQAVSDRCGRILDISINYGGASSDILAFEASDLYQRLNSGILADGLVLFGDNAYLNTPFMATPYPNAKPGAEDNYNFYHSQVSNSILYCIESELCAMIALTFSFVDQFLLAPHPCRMCVWNASPPLGDTPFGDIVQCNHCKSGSVSQCPCKATQFLYRRSRETWL